MKTLKSSLWIFASLFLLAAPVSLADDEPLPWDGPAFSADAKVILAAAGRIERSPESAVTVFVEERHLVADAEERVKNTFHRVYRVESQAGVENWSQTGVEWWPWRQKKPQVRARVIAPDGAVHELDQTLLTDAAADQRPDLYDDKRELSGPLPAVTISAIVEEEFVFEDTSPIFKGATNIREYFGHDQPVLRTALTIEAPASLRLRYATSLLPDAKITRVETNGIVSIHLEQGLLKAFRNTEQLLPDDVLTWPFIDISFAESWNSVAAAYYRTVEGSVRPDDVAALLAGSKGLTGDALLRRLLTSLHEQVRYTGVEFGISSLVPHGPKETVGHKYGDCKDKALVLVSMLQAVGIPARLALLSTRGSSDVNPEMPGFGEFDHAIVYIPGPPAMWIDATAQYQEPGTLPWADQGRLALIVDPQTSELARIPVAKPADNLLIETREFTLAEYGPVRIVETSVAHGSSGSGFRSSYAETDVKETREALENYMKDEYSVEAPTIIKHSRSADLTREFTLTLESAKARRGYSGVEDALVYIHPSGLANSVPQAVRPQGDEEAADKDKLESNKRVHDIFFEPFVTERRYHIIPSPGFVAQTLPQDQTIQLGPATLAETYKTEADGSVSVVLRFDSVKPRYSLDELRDFRLASVKVQKSDWLSIRFVQRGQMLLAQGDVKGALAAYEALAAMHPSEALHHVQIANTMLAAGLGDQARLQIDKAALLEPKSAQAFKAKGWILEHDLIGRRFGPGFDLSGGIAAYRKAEELDPSEFNTKANLAILLEHDARGYWHSPESRIADALIEFKSLAELDPQRSKDYDDNVLLDLCYLKRWKEAADKAASLPANSTRQGVLVAAAAAQQGIDAAVAEAGRRTSNEADKSKALVTAADLLVSQRMYPETVALLNAAAPGQQNPSATRARAQVLSAVRPYEQVLLPAADVRRAVQDYFICFIDSRHSLDELVRLTEFFEGDKKQISEAFSRQSISLRRKLKAQNATETGTLDAVLSNLKFSVEGDDASGYRLRVQPMGAGPFVVLTAKLPEGFRLVSIGADYSNVGLEVLRRLKTGETANAKRWLDWAREETSLRTGDDALGGSIPARFWTRGDDADPAKMKLAGIANLVSSSAIADYLQEIKAARAAAQDSSAQANLDLLLAAAAERAKNWPATQEAAQRLLDRYPTSDTALALFESACRRTKDWSAWQKAISVRLAKLPDDAVGERSAADLASAQSEFVQARTALRKLIDGGKEDSRILNSYSWLALFVNNVTGEDVNAAQQASSLPNGHNFGVLHTLACLYAETGKTKEAREQLLAAMDAGGLDQPNSEIWYGFGRIAEDYGVVEAARADYERMKSDSEPEQMDFPESTLRLGIKRLANLPQSGKK